MGGARALIASLGASFSLVAGAALALLLVSFVFAYDGIVSVIADAPPRAALVVDAAQQTSGADAGVRRAADAPVVVRTPAPTTETDTVRRPEASALRGGARVETLTPMAAVGDLAPAPPATSRPADRPTTGEGVRELGDSVGAKVQDTGQAAGGVAAPLGPPVSAALQRVVDLITSLLQGAAGAVGGTVDQLTGQR